MLEVSYNGYMYVHVYRCVCVHVCAFTEYRSYMKVPLIAFSCNCIYIPELLLYLGQHMKCKLVV